MKEVNYSAHMYTYIHLKLQTFKEPPHTYTHIHTYIHTQTLKGEMIKEVIYSAGEHSSKFTLVLDGNVDVLAGEDGFSCARGP